MSPETLSAGPVTLVETAPAKVNLSLTVLGHRPDGYHELESLAAFAYGDDPELLSLDLSGPLRLGIGGADASALPTDEGNLVMRAAMAVAADCPDARLGAFQLEKRLPVAAGIGGGSADAAAALRLLRRANPALADRIDWMKVAAFLGADVPVCLASRAAVMRGIGERVEPLGSLPPIWAVLVNPRVPLATAPVFKALAAPPFDGSAPRRPFRTTYAGFDELIAALEVTPNDLEATAKRLCPEVSAVQAALRALDGARLTRMSGSGPTCFALFATPEAAHAGAAALRRQHPHWWVKAAELR